MQKWFSFSFLLPCRVVLLPQKSHACSSRVIPVRRPSSLNNPSPPHWGGGARACLLVYVCVCVAYVLGFVSPLCSSAVGAQSPFSCPFLLFSFPRVFVHLAPASSNASLLLSFPSKNSSRFVSPLSPSFSVPHKKDAGTQTPSPPFLLAYIFQQLVWI